jgi:1-acyl-sn-glycerol-3-phosphate acyltransferase
MLGFWAMLTPPAAVVALLWTVLTRDVGFLYRVGIAISRAGVRIAGLRVQAEGLEHLQPESTYIFLSNHVSNLDPPVLLPLIPRRTSVLAKRELFRIPILGQVMRIARLVPVDRDHRGRAFESLRAASEVLRDGINMTIFVEGTRSPDGHLLRFKKGPFHLAMDTRVPVVPVTIVGTYEAQPKGRFTVRPGIVRVVFHEPIQTAKFRDRDTLMEAVRERIASALPPEFR